jgi:DnaJ-class molecular chaperone
MTFEWAVVVDCPSCEGRGSVESDTPHGICRQTGAPLYSTHQCSECGGSGKTEEPTAYVIDEDPADRGEK